MGKGGEENMKDYHTLVIDRFEGEYAVCEDEKGGFHDLAKVELPRGVGEGDVLVREGDGWKIDAAETLRRRKKAHELFESLMRDN